MSLSEIEQRIAAAKQAVLAETALIPVERALTQFNTEGLFRLVIQPLAGQGLDADFICLR